MGDFIIVFSIVYVVSLLINMVYQITTKKNDFVVAAFPVINTIAAFFVIFKWFLQAIYGLSKIINN